MSYLDNLRSFVIFLVVVMHSNVTYSGLGGWYYKEGNPAKLGPASLIAFAAYGSWTQAWFMGILFFVAAYFAAKSLAKRGPGAFVGERLFRLGLPTLIYALLVDPFIGYFLMDYDGVRSRLGPGRAYLDYLASFRWAGSTGPLWFAEVLLDFSCLYALFRALRPAARRDAPAPRARSILLLVAATGIAAFAIRLVLPIGTSFGNLQFCYFATYIALFALGIHAGERNWLPSFPEKAGFRWLLWTAAAGALAWPAIMILGGAARGDSSYSGGMNWQSLAYASWEAAVAVGFSLGFVALFRRFVGMENRLTRIIADNSFGVYMFHAPVLVGLSLALRGWGAPPLAKHLLVAPSAFALTLALSALVLRRIPGLKLLLK